MSPAVNRIRIPEHDYTRFPNEFFEKQLGLLSETNGAAVYAVLYDHAYHNQAPVVNASYTDLSDGTNLDARVVKNCLRELRHQKLIYELKSKTWEVPAAKLDRRGEWTPVPRLLIREYIPAYHNSVLLLQILHIQHYNWLNYSWVGVPKLSTQMNWGKTRVRDAIETMSVAEKWNALRTGLPRPLSHWHSARTGENRYRVRAVRYEGDKKTRKSTGTFRLTHEFAKHFHVPIL
jgi:hypothetical protein